MHKSKSSKKFVAHHKMRKQKENQDPHKELLSTKAKTATSSPNEFTASQTNKLFNTIVWGGLA